MRSIRGDIPCRGARDQGSCEGVRVGVWGSILLAGGFWCCTGLHCCRAGGCWAGHMAGRVDPPPDHVAASPQAQDVLHLRSATLLIGDLLLDHPLLPCELRWDGGRQMSAACGPPRLRR